MVVLFFFFFKQKTAYEMRISDWSSDVCSSDLDVSAKTKQGIDTLLEALLLQAEVLELTANPDRTAEGVVIEAKVERGRGSVATVLVQRGTLHVGDVFVAGAEWGKVRALVDDRGVQVESAGPTQPVEVLGLQGTPTAGDEFVVVEHEGHTEARRVGQEGGRTFKTRWS